MTILTYSEGPGLTLAQVHARVTVEGESSTIVKKVVARLNADRTPRMNGWLSLIVWTNDYRNSANWLSGCGFAGDLDWRHYEVEVGQNGKTKRKFVR